MYWILLNFKRHCRYWISVLWRCWLGGRKGIRPLKKTEWWGTGVVICLERGADLHMAQPMPLPLTVSCSSKIQIGFTFLVPAYPGSPGKRAVKRVCVQVLNSQSMSPVSLCSLRGSPGALDSDIYWPAQLCCVWLQDVEPTTNGPSITRTVARFIQAPAQDPLVCSSTRRQWELDQVRGNPSESLLWKYL